MIMTLPFPPSVNHYWRKWRNRMVISKKGREYRTAVCGLLAGGGNKKPPIDGRVALCMDAFPPDRRRRDLDNLLKSTCDSLTYAGAYRDDFFIDLLIVRRKEPVQHGKIIIQLFEKPLNRCPLCGADYDDG
jgi:crossover junction endodeoxyribonuclease RusA